ncbi:MAG TPA: thioredoxin family protein [Kofleriaceae bacterium]|nr:thioredoxin family protein [Kofleriaceae bacterium]
MIRATHLPLYLSSLSLSLALACGGSQSDEPTATAPAPGESAAAVPATAQTAGATAPAPQTGTPAPDFTLADLDGKQVQLSSLKGKTVVLEWFNPGCPFVRYSHGEGPLKDLAKKHTADGVVWLAINSGSEGKQGAGAEMNRAARQDWSIDYPILIDANGQVGKAYDAKTTPHMFVIDGNGQIVYRGALDNAPLGKVPADGQVNYVENALASLAAGKPVEVAETKSYGCSVKYGSL